MLLVAETLLFSVYGMNLMLMLGLFCVWNGELVSGWNVLIILLVPWRPLLSWKGIRLTFGCFV